MDTWDEQKKVALIANALLREGYAAWPDVIEMAQQVYLILKGRVVTKDCD